MKKNKNLRIILSGLVLLAAIFVGGFLIYASDYYKADDLATNVLNTNKNIEVRDNLIVFKPVTESETALIFYPGAKVEYTAYLPILEKISQRSGIMCVLVKMPLNMAIFDSNAADDIIEHFPDIKNWYIGGHSMGGAMASDYAYKHKDQIKGLILLGAYIYGDYPAEKSLTVYGSFNSNLEKHIDYTENIVIIQGGNHAQFGNYGKQKGDIDATISAQQQQEITVKAIDEFIKT